MVLSIVLSTVLSIGLGIVFSIVYFKNIWGYCCPTQCSRGGLILNLLGIAYKWISIEQFVSKKDLLDFNTIKVKFLPPTFFSSKALMVRKVRSCAQCFNETENGQARTKKINPLHYSFCLCESFSCRMCYTH